MVTFNVLSIFKRLFSCFCIRSEEAESCQKSLSFLFAEVILVSGKLYLLFCLFIFGCSHKCIPCTSWLWGRAIFSDFPIFDFKTSFASGGCLWSRAVAARPRSSCATIGPGAGLRPPSRLGRCCWNWWKRLGSCPAGLARTFFFRRFLGAARGAAAGAKVQPDGAVVRGAGARHGPSPRGSAAGRGWVAARAGPEGAARAAGPGSPSGGPRGTRAALSGRSERDLAVGRRRRSWRGDSAERRGAGVTGRRRRLLLEGSEQGP